jgi:hypothetical protein
MQVSANIIRFPAPSTLVDRSIEAKQETDNVLAFPSADQPPVFSPESQERGQVFAAHRIVGRVADQLDSFPAL